MKQTNATLLLSVSLLAASCLLHAQNTFPLTGNVGIGTTSPATLLEVTGDATINGVTVGRGAGNFYDNTSLGSAALSFSNSGNSNTAVGSNALYDNNEGNNNTSVGAYSLQYTHMSSFNTALGSYALNGNNSTGGRNTAVGANAMFSNAGESNVAIGMNAMIGYNEFDAITSSGSRNVAIGSYALAKYITGNENTAVGYSTLQNNTTGSENTATGNYVMKANTTGRYNTSSGRYSLSNNTIGNDNTASGDRALQYNITGSNNTGIGYSATPNTSALSNTTCLGYFARATASNQVRLGNNAVTSIGGYANWTNISDGRVKRNIKENVPGLAFISQLKPVTYTLALVEAEKIVATKNIDGKAEEPITLEEQQERDAKEKIVYTGFIAQDVEKAAKLLKYEFSGVDAPSNSNSLYGLRYAEFVVPLVKAVQELSAENEKLKNDIEEIKALLKSNKTITANLTSASLEQNIPNPLKNSTTIKYTLPAQYAAAKIIVTDITGKTIKDIALSAKGNGNVVMDTNGLSNGTYQYTLYVNGSMADSKQMIVAK